MASAAWRAANPEKAREYERERGRRRRAADPEKHRERNRRWRAANREQVHEYNSRRWVAERSRPASAGGAARQRPVAGLSRGQLRL